MKRITPHDNRRGLTIVEIVISLVFLCGCIALLGELSRNAFRNARESKDLTQAELLAESILAKVRLGIIDMESASEKPVTDLATPGDTIADTNVVSASGAGDILWVYSLDVSEIDEYGLMELAVTVRRNLPEEQRPVSCRLVRWLALEPEESESRTE